MTMKVPFLDLSLQFQSIQVELEAAALRALRSGHYILGPEVAHYESRFAAYLGVSHAVGVASGTDAIELALRAVDVKPGDDVLTVANVSAPTICAIQAAGARPVLIDVDPGTMNIDVGQVADYLNSSNERHKARAIVPVHLYGRMADMKSIGEIALKFSLKVVEDASQAHGATCGFKQAGTLGDVGCFSHYPTKNLGACGDAGISATNVPEIAERLVMLRNYGEHRRYLNHESGRNSRLDEIQAALLDVKLNHLDRWNARRRQIAAIYNQHFKSLGLQLPGDAPENLEGHVYHLYVVKTHDRDAFQASLASRGVGSAVHYPRPVHMQPAFENTCHVPFGLPNTEQACRTVISLPLYPELTDAQVNEICRAVESIRRNASWILPNIA